MGSSSRAGPAAANGATSSAQCQIAFTSNSQHLYYSSVQDIDLPSSPARLVWDGKPGPWGLSGKWFSYVVFSPDGNHAAYPWNPPNSSVPTQQFVVDAQLAPYKSDSFKFAGQGLDIFSTIKLTSTAPKYTQIVEGLIDGKAVGEGG